MICGDEFSEITFEQLKVIKMSLLRSSFYTAIWIFYKHFAPTELFYSLLWIFYKRSAPPEQGGGCSQVSYVVIKL